VFGYLAVAGSRRPKLRDWLAVAGMSAGIGVFLRLAAPSGGRLHAPGSSWLLAGLVTGGVVLAALAGAFGLRGRSGASRSRRAAVLGSATGISWGFMAAVIKELSSHLGDGISALVTTWSLYVLLAAGLRPCCWPRTRWRSARWPPPSPGSPSTSVSWISSHGDTGDAVGGAAAAAPPCSWTPGRRMHVSTPGPSAGRRYTSTGPGGMDFAR